MKVQSFVLCFLLTLLSVSCIREEAPNAEADILSCTVDGDILKAEPEIGNESVTLTVKSDADITNLAPVFTLTPGATLLSSRLVAPLLILRHREPIRLLPRMAIGRRPIRYVASSLV